MNRKATTDVEDVVVRKWICLFAVGLFIQLSVAQAVAQDPAGPDDGTRHLWNTAYIAPAPGTTARRSPAKRIYRIATPKVPLAGVTADTVVGVTLWRLRAARSSDAGERIISHDGSDAVDWVPERVSTTTRLKQGDRLRISIEAARTGYLYVINREEYSNGTSGEPILIFPTTRTRGGDNQVSVGRVIEIPAQEDAPPFFTLRKSRPEHVAESVTIIVSPLPIEGLIVTDKQQRLTEEQVAAWEKQWGGEAGRLEMQGGAGKPWTSAEKDAGSDGTRSLTKADPVPQTVLYRPGVASDRGVLYQVKLNYARRGSRNRAR